MSLIGIVSALLSGAQSGNERLAQERHQETLTAWEREMQRIRDENAEKANRFQRRKAMARAVGLDAPLLPPKPTPLSSAGEKPLYGGSESDLATAANIFGNLGALGIDEGSIGSALGKISSPGIEMPDVQPISYSPTLPDVGQLAAGSISPPARTYQFEDYYKPTKPYLTQGQ